MPPKILPEGAPSWLVPVLRPTNERRKLYIMLWFRTFYKGAEITVCYKKNEVACIEWKSLRFSKDSRPAFHSTLVKINTRIVGAKACRVTWVGIVEQTSEQATYDFSPEGIKL